MLRATRTGLLPLITLLAATGAPLLPARSAGVLAQELDLGGPLIVGDERIPEVELRRHLIHAVGANVLQRIRMRWMVEAELTDRAHRHALHAGKPPAETFERTYNDLNQALAVSEEELDAEVAYQRSFLHWRHPGLDPDATLRREFGTLAEFREQVRATLLFDRVFLPDDPDEWPRLTVEAFLADPGGGTILIDDARESYLTRIELGKEYGDDPPRDDESLRRTYRDIVRRSLDSWLDIRTAVDGLTSPWIATVDFDADGEPEEQLLVDDVWPDVAPLVSDEDVRLARRWVATVTAARSQLLETGFGPEARLQDLARQALQAHDDQGQGSSAPWAQWAPWVGGFPSAEIYFEYMWLREGVRRRYGRDLAHLGKPERDAAAVEPFARSAQGTRVVRHSDRPQAKRPYIPEDLADPVFRLRSIVGRAEVHAEFLLIAAWDEETATWNDDGWSCALEQATEIADTLRQKVGVHQLQVRRFRKVTVDSPEQLWDRALEEHSEFWEPKATHTARPVGRLDKGRFRMRTFGELSTMLRVDEYRRFALGGSLADEAMFHAPVGTIVGPVRGPLGYYLMRVRSRTPNARPVDPSNWLDEVLDEATIDYARAALEAVEVSGLD